MELNEIVVDIGGALACIDKNGQSFRSFRPGVGPCGEPQLVGAIAKCLNELPKYLGAVRTKRTPDLLIPNGVGN